MRKQMILLIGIVSILSMTDCQKNPEAPEFKNVNTTTTLLDTVSTTAVTVVTAPENETVSETIPMTTTVPVETETHEKLVTEPLIETAEMPSDNTEMVTEAIPTEATHPSVPEIVGAERFPENGEHPESVLELSEVSEIQEIPTVSPISVDCLKVTWNSEPDREYNVSCEPTDPEYAYGGNIHFIMKANNLCYINGLRENSEYRITVAPIPKDGEELTSFEPVISRTETVEVIEEFPYEDGWTNCFAYERASELTAMPSSGAIYGSIADPITGTGIRRDEYGDYCCAMGLFYGTCWDRFLIELENGIQFTVKICDSKGWADDADGDGIADGRFHWFGGGKCIVEFIHDGYQPPSGVSFTGSYGYYNWNGLDLGANIRSIQKINYGEPIEY